MIRFQDEPIDIWQSKSFADSLTEFIHSFINKVFEYTGIITVTLFIGLSYFFWHYFFSNWNKFVIA